MEGVLHGGELRIEVTYGKEGVIDGEDIHGEE